MSGKKSNMSITSYAPYPESNSFNVKKQILKTPHPKFYKREDRKEEGDSKSSTRIDINLATMDKTFISEHTAKAFEETEHQTRYKRIFNEKRDTFPRFPKISDYFVDFSGIMNKNKKRLKSSDEKKRSMIVLDESLMFSNINDRSKSSATFSTTSQVIYTGQITSIRKSFSKNSNKDTPTFGALSGNSQITENKSMSVEEEKEVTHPKLPFYLKNNEIFKSFLVNDLKKKKMSTDTHKFIINRKRKFSEMNKIMQFDHSIFKRRKSASAKKIYQSDLPFIDIENDPKYFKFYRDDDIGITQPWRVNLIPQSIDNDTDTDEDTLQNGVYESIIGMKYAIEQFLEEDITCLSNNMNKVIDSISPVSALSQSIKIIMGNKFFNMCSGKDIQTNELHSEIGVDKEVEVENHFTQQQVDDSANKIQSKYKAFRAKNDLSEEEKNQMREFDENIINHGNLISEYEMAEYTSDNVKKMEAMLKALNLSDEDMNKYKHVFKRDPIKFNDGTIYYGQWNFLGKKQGYGVYIKPDGSKYEGFWYDDKIEGPGRYIDKLGNYYEGQWINGMANGKGILVVAQGSKYDGNWSNDVQEGYGEEFFTDGTTYQGNYQNGHKHGQGKFTWSDGSLYQGEFVNSTISGQGTLHWKDGREYSGDWLNNKMHGYGTFSWPDGKKYIGQYRNDKKEGFGNYYWNEDKYYEGEWLNSKQHGEGKFVLKGKTLKGQFRFGKLIKRNEDDNKENKDNKEINIMCGSIDKQLSNILSSNIGAKETKGLIAAEDVFNIEVDDEHHIEKMNVGNTISRKMN